MFSSTHSPVRERNKQTRNDTNVFDKYHNGEKHRVLWELIGRPFSLYLKEKLQSLPIGEDARGESGITTESKLTLSPKTLNKVQEGLLGKSWIWKMLKCFPWWWSFWIMVPFVLVLVYTFI